MNLNKTNECKGFPHTCVLARYTRVHGHTELILESTHAQAWEVRINPNMFSKNWTFLVCNLLFSCDSCNDNTSTHPKPKYDVSNKGKFQFWGDGALFLVATLLYSTKWSSVHDALWKISIIRWWHFIFLFAVKNVYRSLEKMRISILCTLNQVLSETFPKLIKCLEELLLKVSTTSKQTDASRDRIWWETGWLADGNIIQSFE